MAGYSDPGTAPRVGVYAGGGRPKPAKKPMMPKKPAMPMKPKRRGLLAGLKGG